MTRRRLLVANWKMNKTRRDAVVFANQLAELGLVLGAPAQDPTLQAVICAPFTALFGLSAVFAPFGVEIGAQNMHESGSGAFTGEVSAAMLCDLACRYVIVGHSERRQLFAETDEVVGRKVAAAFASDLVPIACIGESARERAAGVTANVVLRQLAPLLGALREYPQQAARLVIAYEPIWAIGTGQVATAQDAQTVAQVVRAELRTQLGEDVAQRLRILYGGSVKPDNIGGFVAQPDIDGALVGGASLEASSFAALAAAMMRTSEGSGGASA